MSWGERQGTFSVKEKVPFLNNIIWKNLFICRNCMQILERLEVRMVRLNSILWNSWFWTWKHFIRNIIQNAALIVQGQN